VGLRAVTPKFYTVIGQAPPVPSSQNEMRPPSRTATTARVATVFLVLPPDRLGTYARWLRPMLSQSLQDMAQREASGSVGLARIIAGKTPEIRMCQRSSDSGSGYSGILSSVRKRTNAVARRFDFAYGSGRSR
jgi:hypothetical protein